MNKQDLKGIFIAIVGIITVLGVGLIIISPVAVNETARNVSNETLEQISNLTINPLPVLIGLIAVILILLIWFRK